MKLSKTSSTSWANNAVMKYLLSIWPELILQTFTYNCICKSEFKTGLHDKAVHKMNLLKTCFLTCSQMNIYIAAATVLLITCIAKLIFMASCAKFQVSVSQQYPLSHCPFTTSSQTFVTTCLRKWLNVHLRRGGGSNPVLLSWLWNLKKDVFSETPNCYKALT